MGAGMKKTVEVTRLVTFDVEVDCEPRWWEDEAQAAVDEVLDGMIGRGHSTRHGEVVLTKVRSGEN